ncbi:VOC family protein [Cellulomonas sp. PhB143]|uniref:VOC family protein n=1 Tax=Cellulomonas sp. PhB143 TaxID=2485186 RepID=UPI000F467370|nr:VOC family protein [Cellulomonas sp. PhB143]ROS76879.1 catechol 2,3-dioxygenase [Cellulomonas sp. PhB143]
MSTDRIADSTRMDAVTLHVRDLDATTSYYRDGIGLDVLDDAPALGPEAAAAAADPRAATVALGRGGRPLVVLRHEPDLPPAPAGQAGLFHTALLFDDAAGLAGSVAGLAGLAPGTFVGSADHLVSQAFYFTDPEGNGVELYVDRPRDTWRWDGGRVAMDTRHLDPRAFLDEHLAPEHLAPEPRSPGRRPATGSGAGVGHVHLQVGDVAVAREFYVGVLGFAETARVPGALFVSAGGYHHHLAMNTWNSRGAGPRAASLGLGQVSITVPAPDDVAALADRLAHAGLTGRHDGASLRFDDPWGTLVEVRAAA